MKPAPIVRALERASAAKWAAGREARTRHINALATGAREQEEDHREQMAACGVEILRLQMYVKLWPYGLLP